MSNQKLKNVFQHKLLEAGVDEAGRGCLAGPVVAAAVILPKGFYHKLLNDSKKLTSKTRDNLELVIKKESISFGIGIASVSEIDAINILQASLLAMHRAISNLEIKPELLLIDGNKFNPYRGMAHETIIGGDGKYLSIAAASVLAKTERDRIMCAIDLEFPEYHWKKNKGYGTIAHRDAIRNQGANIHHRKSFKLLPAQLSIF